MNQPLSNRGGPRRDVSWRRFGIATVICAVAIVLALVLGHDPARAHSKAPARPARAASTRQSQTDYGKYQLTANGTINPAVQSQIDQQSGGKLTTVHFYSTALGREADYLVFLPAGYSVSSPLPVMYLLHGMPGTPMGPTLNSNIEVRMEQLIRAHEINPMIIVFPDGRIGGSEQSDSEWANTPSGNYASYVINVVDNVDGRFATRACRQERALVGLSAGAYGAANVGLHNVATFGTIQVWSGYFIETHNGVFANASRQTMINNSPSEYVGSMASVFAQYPLRIALYVGRSDPFATQLPAMVAALQQAGADEWSATYPGTHSWKLWSAHLPQMLEMASHDFAHPLANQPVSCT